MLPETSTRHRLGSMQVSSHAKAIARRRSSGMLGYVAAMPSNITSQDPATAHLQPVAASHNTSFTTLLNAPLQPADVAMSTEGVPRQAWQLASNLNTTGASARLTGQQQDHDSTANVRHAGACIVQSGVDDVYASHQQPQQYRVEGPPRGPNHPGMLARPADQHQHVIGQSSESARGDICDLVASQLELDVCSVTWGLGYSMQQLYVDYFWTEILD